MAVRQLRLVGFRALATQTLGLSPGLNILFGDNASGKTSLLEALDIASRGRSFRSHNLSEISNWTGNGEWALDLAHDHAAGEQLLKLRYRGGNLEARRQSEIVNREQMARSLPALILGPDLHRLMDDGPKIRRAFLDWALFHVEHSFAAHWRRYQHALRQRNAAVRHQATRAQISAWSASLLSAGTVITRHRQQLVEGLRLKFAAAVNTTDLLPGVDISYRQGWAKDLSFEVALARADAHFGAQSPTPVGPHRGDLELLAGDARVQTALSRGQQKVFLISLALALAHLVHERIGHWPLLAVDDWRAELSDKTATSILETFRSYPGQRILSSFASPTTPLAEARLFHVEQGQFTEC